ncbi:MAG: hypothetical protein NZ521_06625, partial [Flammeovirgaceae bacterium]|nr:hypothetical protein [Flammeovirgaceae bacterium]MDW8287901.1 two-component regulator propeller domain-containing protein [Flammeovirgaceae bacterium]
MKTIYCLLFVYFSVSLFPIFAQKEKGRYFIRNFTPKEYQAHTQNWSAVQDDRGLMYIGNTSGILEYDGKNWRLIYMPNRTTVRTISKGKDGVIYLGSQGDFGFLKPNAQGLTEFISLTKQLPAEHRNFKDVWTTHAGNDGVYFMTDYKIYRLNPDGTFSYFFPTSNAFFLSFYVNGKLYVHESKVGLLVLKNGKFELMKDGEKFKGMALYTLISRIDGTLVAGAGKGGLFLIDETQPTGQAVQPWNIPVNTALQEGILYCGMKIDQKLIFGTLKNGVYVVDEQTGELLTHLHQEVGLQNNQVWNIGKDNQGGIWACTNKGLSRIELSTPF